MSFIGTNTNRLVAAAKKEFEQNGSGKKTEILYKGFIRVTRKVRIHADRSAKLVEQVTFAAGGKEGILPDKHYSIA
jgi:hypothetical protein